jgi:hypothetical protein
MLSLRRRSPGRRRLHARPGLRPGRWQIQRASRIFSGMTERQRHRDRVLRLPRSHPAVGLLVYSPNIVGTL